MPKRKPAVSPPRHDPSKAKPYEVREMDYAAEKRRRGLVDVRDAPRTVVEGKRTTMSGPPLSERSVPRNRTSISRVPVEAKLVGRTAQAGGYLKDSLGRPVRAGGDGSKVRVSPKPRGRA